MSTTDRAQSMVHATPVDMSSLIRDAAGRTKMVDKQNYKFIIHLHSFHTFITLKAIYV